LVHHHDEYYIATLLNVRVCSDYSSLKIKSLMDAHDADHRLIQ